VSDSSIEAGLSSAPFVSDAVLAHRADMLRLFEAKGANTNTEQYADGADNRARTPHTPLPPGLFTTPHMDALRHEAALREKKLQERVSRPPRITAATSLEALQEMESRLKERRPFDLEIYYRNMEARSIQYAQDLGLPLPRPSSRTERRAPPPNPGSGGTPLEQTFARLAKMQQVAPRQTNISELRPSGDTAARAEGAGATEPKLIRREASIPPIPDTGELQEIKPKGESRVTHEVSLSIPNEDLTRKVTEIPAGQKNLKHAAELGIDTQLAHLAEVKPLNDRRTTHEAGIGTTHDSPHLSELKPPDRRTRIEASLEANLESLQLAVMDANRSSHESTQAQIPHDGKGERGLEPIGGHVILSRIEATISREDVEENLDANAIEAMTPKQDGNNKTFQGEIGGNVSPQARMVELQPQSMITQDSVALSGSTGEKLLEEVRPHQGQIQRREGSVTEVSQVQNIEQIRPARGVKETRTAEIPREDVVRSLVELHGNPNRDIIDTSLSPEEMIGMHPLESHTSSRERVIVSLGFHEQAGPSLLPLKPKQKPLRRIISIQNGEVIDETELFEQMRTGAQSDSLRYLRAYLTEEQRKQFGIEQDPNMFTYKQGNSSYRENKSDFQGNSNGSERSSDKRRIDVMGAIAAKLRSAKDTQNPKIRGKSASMGR